jgi:hypothetical protein
VDTNSQKLAEAIKTMAVVYNMNEQELWDIFQMSAFGNERALFRLKSIMGSKKRTYKSLFKEVLKRFGSDSDFPRDPWLEWARAVADFKAALKSELLSFLPKHMR